MWGATGYVNGKNYGKNMKTFSENVLTSKYCGVIFNYDKKTLSEF